MLHIKRYSNRKLYDTDNRRYITLPEIARYLRQGEEIQVTDHASGADLTTLVMLQALFSAEKRLGGWLPPRHFDQFLETGEKSLQRLLYTLSEWVDFNPIVNQVILRRLEQLVAKGELSSQEAERLANLLVGAFSSPEQAEMPQPAQRETLNHLLADLERLSSLLDEIAAPPGQ